MNPYKNNVTFKNIINKELAGIKALKVQIDKQLTELNDNLSHLRIVDLALRKFCKDNEIGVDEIELE